MRKKKLLRVRCIVSILIASHILYGCSLLPKEQEAREVLVIKTQEAEDFEMAVVQRGDIENVETIYCTYTQRNGEELSFGMDGLTVKDVYVSIGDQVKEGDLLAQISLEDVEREIVKLEYSMQKLSLQQASLQKQFDIEKELIDLTAKRDMLSEQDEEQKVEQLEKDYKKRISVYKDDFHIQQLQLEELRKEVKAGRIYAGQDGIISYVHPGLQTNPTSKDQAALIVMEDGDCAFKATSKYVDDLVDGESVVLTLSDGGSVETMISKSTEEENVVYFVLNAPNFELSVGARATYSLVLERSENTLTIPTKALQRAADFYYVYIENEDGIRTLQKITIGIKESKRTEVLSGLKEGDRIIVD